MEGRKIVGLGWMEGRKGRDKEETRKEIMKDGKRRGRIEEKLREREEEVGRIEYKRRMKGKRRGKQIEG